MTQRLWNPHTRLVTASHCGNVTVILGGDCFDWSRPVDDAR